MDKLRLRFKKTGRAIYISHLDLMQTMQRAFSRAGYELMYSQGFNPHPQISILLPLSVGMASICELMDLRLKEEADLEELPARLTAALPEGIEALECYEAQRKSAQLKYLRVEGRIEYDDGELDRHLHELRNFYSREQIVVNKKTKRGFSDVDIRPSIRELELCSTGEHLRLEAVISAQEPTLNPELLIQALVQNASELAPDFAQFTRLETYDADMQIYR